MGYAPTGETKCIVNFSLAGKASRKSNEAGLWSQPANIEVLKISCHKTSLYHNTRIGVSVMFKGFLTHRPHYVVLTEGQATKYSKANYWKKVMRKSGLLA